MTAPGGCSARSQRLRRGTIRRGRPARERSFCPSAGLIRSPVLAGELLPLPPGAYPGRGRGRRRTPYRGDRNLERILRGGNPGSESPPDSPRRAPTHLEGFHRKEGPEGAAEAGSYARHNQSKSSTPWEVVRTKLGSQTWRRGRWGRGQSFLRWGHARALRRAHGPGRTSS